jgi:ketosteroid isomerase-like protein
MAYPNFLREARKFGARDCSFCHAHPEGGNSWNERGLWLIREKERRKAEVIDVNWLADYKPEAPRDEGKGAQDDAQLIRAIEDLAESYKQRDPAAIDKFLAEDFTLADQDGRLYDKAGALALWAQIQVARSALEELTVRHYGEVAIATYLWKVEAILAGKQISATYRLTDVWVKREGIWRLVASHRSGPRS